jgi:hypothetical protein
MIHTPPPKVYRRSSRSFPEDLHSVLDKSPNAYRQTIFFGTHQLSKWVGMYQNHTSGHSQSESEAASVVLFMFRTGSKSNFIPVFTPRERVSPLRPFLTPELLQHGSRPLPIRSLTRSASSPRRGTFATALRSIDRDGKKRSKSNNGYSATPSQIGVVLRDSHGIAQVRNVTGKLPLKPS